MWNAVPPPPDRRHPPRRDVATYRLRVDLEDTVPPLWRRLEVASDLALDDLHAVLQVAFGWTDSHLHRFASDARPTPETQYYLGPFDRMEDDAGVPEEQVRIDEVLAAPGDRAAYQYDYGDDWWHMIELEAVTARAPGAPRARCTDGRRPGPPEDCGGVHGYELIVGAGDPSHPDHAERAAEFDRFYGGEFDPADFDLVPFDVDDVDRQLQRLELGAGALAPEAVPASVAELLDRVLAPDQRRHLRRLVADAGLDRPATVDADTAGAMVRPYRWFVEHVDREEDGIRLTSAGYLPPAHVRATVDALGLLEDWIGAGNRENQTMPVLHLRQSATRLGLLRKHRGRLLATARGRRLVGDPVQLWAHLARRMPLGPSGRDGEAARLGGLVLLTILAAGRADEPVGPLAVDVLDAMGWRHGDGTPLVPATVAHLLWDDTTLLRRIGALERGPGDRWPGRVTPDGVMFARAALQTADA